MASDLIAHIKTSGLTLYRREAKRLQRVLVCTERSQVLPLLAAFFAENGIEPVSVVLDIADESFSLQTLPYLSKNDLTALIQRRCQQLHPNRRFLYQSMRGREKSGRRDARVLFAAVTAEDMLEGWLTPLYELAVPVAAVQSLPLLGEKPAMALSGGGDILLIGVDETASGFQLRQNFYHQGVLVLSRLLAFADSDADHFPLDFRDEIDRSRRFLSRQFPLTAQDSLLCHVFCSTERLRQSLAAIDFSGASLHMTCTWIQAHAMANDLDLPEQAGLAHWLLLAARKSPGHYQEARSRFHYRHHRLNKTLAGLSVVLLTVTLGYSLFTLLEHQRLADATVRLQQNHEDLLQQLKQLPAAPQVHGLDALQMQEWLQLRDALVQQSVMPGPVFASIGQVLSGFPLIKLAGLEWASATANRDESDNATAPEPANETTETPNAGDVRLLLHGRIVAFDGNYRAALALIERFSEQLRHAPGVAAVTAQKLPVDLAAHQAITGTADSKASSGEFVLNIIWRRS
ncbi:MAG: hypothetical protein KGZ80_13500 [Methylomonas sp.]|nr:hypothetical protein [Methylomonas sp.]PPD20489.1 MAG: hypothetical protein CTY23_08470 [Methylomonas sp.]PPD52915.1 MAG: hypothetical protein CTY11_07640 [Methylomonas sp.]